MPPKVEMEEENSREGVVLDEPAEGGQGGTNRWVLQDDLSGRRDMHANAAVARAAAILMQLSTSANCVVLLIGIVRMLQVGGLLHVAYHLPPVYSCPHFAL